MPARPCWAYLPCSGIPNTMGEVVERMLLVARDADDRPWLRGAACRGQVAGGTKLDLARERAAGFPRDAAAL